ncbi:MAG: uracil-DNA glycosylase family protein [Planctomycetota bacterium]
MTETAQSTSPRLDPQATFAQAAAYARHLERIGVRWLPKPDAANVETLSEWFESAPTETMPALAEKTSPSVASPIVDPKPPSKIKPTPTSSTSTEPYAIPVLPIAERETRLRDDSQRVATCEKCRVLSKCRTKTVFGEGSPAARFVFFGEGPGRDEDLSGRPFVGKAGQLLTKMILACKLSREEVYIMNTVKCRPPNNRNPEPAEIENCREFFESQLETLQPEYVVCLGLVAAQALLRTKLSVGRMRGKLHHYFDSKVLVTYHPSYLLRAPQAKRAAWEDLQLMLRDAGLMS